MLYLELIKRPVLYKWELVLRTGFSKSTVYRAFDKLVSLNLICIGKNEIMALSVNNLADHLERSHREMLEVIRELRNFGNMFNFGWQSGDEIEFLSTPEKIVETYMMMSEVPYETCLDFGDLEGYVPVLGGMDPVFKFRENRFGQSAKNWAICTTTGPFTECMLRKKDMNRFQSNIDRVNVNVTGKWIIFSDTNDYVMYNDFVNQENPTAVLVRSKVMADCQRMQFYKLAENLERI